MTDLSTATLDEILAEFRRRDVVASLWSTEDTLPIFADDEDLEFMSEDDHEKVAKALLEHAGSKLMDHLGKHGNDFLTDIWYADQAEIMAKALPVVPKA